MSMLLMVKAMQIKVGNPLRKLVLLKLADNANDQGECWPSLQYIADQCEMSKRSVIRHIDDLCSCGMLCKEERYGGVNGQKSNLYTLNLSSDTKSPVTQSHSTSDTKSPVTSDTKSPRTSHSLEPVKEPVIKDLVPSVKNATSPAQHEQLSGFFLLLKNGEEFGLTVKQVMSWTEAYKNVNVNSEIAIMAEWCKANPAKRKTKAGILRFCNAWLSRADKQFKTQPVDKLAQMRQEYLAHPEWHVGDDHVF